MPQHVAGERDADLVAVGERRSGAGAGCTEAIQTSPPSARTTIGLAPVRSGSRSPVARSMRDSESSRPFAITSAPSANATLSGPGPVAKDACTLPSSGLSR